MASASTNGHGGEKYGEQSLRERKSLMGSRVKPARSVAEYI